MAMELTGYKSREELRHWAERLAKFLTENREDGIAAELNSILNETRTDSFLIAVIAKAKRGKSTLINTLLGRHDDMVAPIARMPTSSAITRFAWAAQEQAAVQFRGGGSPVAIPFSRIREFVTEEENPGNVKNVTLVDVAGPFPGLEKDLILVDTPGSGSIHEHHDAILHGFIPQADAVLFLVTAEMPLDQDELSLLQRIKTSDIRKVFFAVNQVDKADAQEIAEGIAHNQLLLTTCGVSVGAMHQISADRAYKGDIAGSGLSSLANEIRLFLAEHKGRVLRERFVSRVHCIAHPLIESLDIRIDTASKTVAELNAELQKLAVQKKELEPNRQFLEREFLLEWDKAIDDFECGLTSVQFDVVREIATRIDNASIIAMKTLPRELPTLIVNNVEGRLREPLQRLEDTLNAAAVQLQAKYAALHLKIDKLGAIRVRDSGEFLGGVTRGALWVSGGTLLAHGGAAIAATIGGLPFIGGALGSLTAIVAAPIAAIPIGIGLFVATRGWYLSRLRKRDQLHHPAREQIGQIVDKVRLEQLPQLRKLGKSLVEEYRLRMDRRLADVEAAIVHARDRRPAPDAIRKMEQERTTLRVLLDENPISNASGATR